MPRLLLADQSTVRSEHRIEVKGPEEGVVPNIEGIESRLTTLEQVIYSELCRSLANMSLEVRDTITSQQILHFIEEDMRILEALNQSAAPPTDSLEQSIIKHINEYKTRYVNVAAEKLAELFTTNFEEYREASSEEIASASPGL